ncbi:TolC family protein [Derxia lacustris]|uniref:TolC family protein n=1 Tax=Derxia lacustris TaxID=764842 RepID=UPI000A175B47|nr:TolC family protein [Derxia lacustris]
MRSASRQRRGHRAATLIALASALALAGCAAGPDYRRPDAPTGTAFREAAGWQSARPADDAIRADWWRAYADPELDALMARLDIGNQNLAAADAALRQSRALSTQARAALWPAIGVSSSAQRSRSSSVTGSSQNSNSGGVRSSYSVALDASWEVDLWGRLRRAYEGVQANVQASAADLENARLSARAQLATDFLQLRVVDAQKRLYADTVAAYERSLTIVRNQYAAGTVARADVVQAETQLQSARAQAIDLDVTRSQLEHSLAVLIGVPPSELRIAPYAGAVATADAGAPAGSAQLGSDAAPSPEATLAGPQLPPLPVAFPASLLERRPDIAAEERRMATANAQIGVSEAAWFPALTLSASSGFSAGLLGDLFTAPARTWALGPALAGTLIDGGTRRGAIEQSRAAYDQQVATYRQTVLGGLQEVEDNLAALRVLADEARVQSEATASARLAAQLVLNQYKAGTVGYLSVLTAQTTALVNERASLTLEGRRLAAHVALVKALGGGWEVPRERLASAGKP